MTFSEFKNSILTKTVGQIINLTALFSHTKATAKMFQLFVQPRKGKINPNEIPKVLEKAVFQTLESEDQTYQYYVWQGNQDIILLVHGWQSNSARWEKLLPFLQKTGKTIVSIDAPAQGLSSGTDFTTPIYVNAIKKLSEIYNPKFIIGHSMGGFAAVYYQYLHQNSNVEKLILLGSPSDMSVLVANFCTSLGIKFKLKQAFENLIEKKYNLKVNDFSAQIFAKAITTKTLVVHDNQDAVVSINEAAKIHKNLENSELLITENLGHSLHDDAVNNSIVAFILEK
jgi:pimeloyl-ACP methyl ester carboxylesterase